MTPFSRNNVQISGSGRRKLVFGHGFGSDQQAWRFVAPAFETDYKLVLFDHVGFGGSDPLAFADARHDSLDGYAQDVLEILDALGDEPVTYVGHSAGAVLGVLASIVAPTRFDRLVLVGMSPRFVNDPPYVGGFEAADIEGLLDLMERDQLAWAAALGPQAIGEQGAPGLVDDFTAGLSRLDPLVARRFGRLVFGVDIRAHLARVTVPSLLIHTTQDSIVPAAVSHYLARHLPRSTLREIGGSGHCPHLTHPAETTALMRAYFDGSIR